MHSAVGWYTWWSFLLLINLLQLAHGQQAMFTISMFVWWIEKREERERGKKMREHREQSAALIFLCATCWGHSKQPAGSCSRAVPSSTSFMCFVMCLTPPSFMSDTRSYFSWTGKVSQGQLSWTYCLFHFGFFLHHSVPSMVEESD